MSPPQPHHVSRPAASPGRTAPQQAPRAVTALPTVSRGGLPGGFSPETLLALQRSAGNAAVLRALEQARHQHNASCGHTESTETRVQRSAVHRVLRSSGRPLDDGIRSEMESRLGSDFSGVRLHTDSTAHTAARSVQADAFTSGSHIVFRRGRYDTSSTAGKRLLAHELTHVIQQRSGPVAGSPTGDGLSVSHPQDTFERAAEANAVRAMAGRPVAQRTAEGRATGAEPGVLPGPVSVQRGQLTTTTDEIDDVWRGYQARTADVDWYLHQQFLPALRRHRKHQGATVTGSSKNRGVPSSGISQMYFNGLHPDANQLGWTTGNHGQWVQAVSQDGRSAPVFDQTANRFNKWRNLANPAGGDFAYHPDKVRAKEVARGLVHWVKEATAGSDRYYAEMRQAVTQWSTWTPAGAFVSANPLLWQFGTNTDTEPDAFSLPPGQQAAVSMESKNVISADNNAVNGHIRKGRFQSEKRATVPNTNQVSPNANFGTWIVAIEIANQQNPWPYTRETAPTIATAAQVTTAFNALRDSGRLRPANSPKPPIAPPYNFAHQLVVTWPNGSPFCAPGTSVTFHFNLNN
ncbi:DUF4157 domain-containing protein [Streptomyces sp. NPDC002588]|uniref:eCIS core domain-containing protein n=1 Tax=Streptomyces sp. NPDC002588 TaxID=3154419 RepID=UPI0033248F5B